MSDFMKKFSPYEDCCPPGVRPTLIEQNLNSRS